MDGYIINMMIHQEKTISLILIIGIIGQLYLKLTILNLPLKTQDIYWTQIENTI